MTSSNTEHKKWSNWSIEIKVWKILTGLILLPVLVFWFLVVHQLDEIIALSRSDIVVDATGNRTWFGTFINTADEPFRDLGITIHFLDRNGQTVAKVETETDVLAAGTGIDLQADLPPEAVNLRIYSVRWRNDRTATMFGPFREPWEFGYLMEGGKQ